MVDGCLVKALIELQTLFGATCKFLLLVQFLHLWRLILDFADLGESTVYLSCWGELYTFRLPMCVRA